MLYLNDMPQEWQEKVLQRIGKNIRRKRMEAGWSLNEMWAHTGIHRQTIHYWEAGSRYPKIEWLLWLCKTTGWKFSEIVGKGNGGSV